MSRRAAMVARKDATTASKAFDFDDVKGVTAGGDGRCDGPGRSGGG